MKDTVISENRKLKITDGQHSGDVCIFEDINADEIPGSVPGDYITDLEKTGLLPDSFFGDNYTKLFEYENRHVFYSVNFENHDEPDDDTFLYFEGIDTVADIYLNGNKIGHADNMFIPWEFPAKGLKIGNNELTVHIFPACVEARQYEISPMCRCLRYNYESLVIRKAAHSFGWDICPRIVSAGIWRPVHLLHKARERIENIFLYTEWINDRGAGLRFAYDADIKDGNVHDFAIRLSGRCRDSVFSVTRKLWFTHSNEAFFVEKPYLWWIKGYGDADLYEVKAELLKNGETVDTYTFNFGIRTIELKNTPCLTPGGEGDFRFILNGKEVYLKGTNWVPADAFHSRDGQRIPAILELVKDCNCNCLRVWGGGVYESDEFYYICDREGFFVWQDFMMACGIYPHDSRMKNILADEVKKTVRRLRNHPSICLWAGDNECDDGYIGAGLNPSENVLTRQVIPDVLRQEDMSRPYLPSSPYCSEEAFEKRATCRTPEQHLWGPRDYYKGDFYRNNNAIFASEMGYHGCPSPESIKKFIPEEYLFPETDNKMWLYHAASPELDDGPYNYRIGLMSRQISYVFREKPKTLNEYAMMSQCVQAEAKKYFIESFRSQNGRKSGLIWWNIMDCWPQFSDAVVDYYFCRKLAYSFIKTSQSPLCLMFNESGDKLKLYAVSDLQKYTAISFRVTDSQTEETVYIGNATAEADVSIEIFAIDKSTEPKFYTVEWTTQNGEKGKNHYLDGTPLFEFDWYFKNLKKNGLDKFEGFGQSPSSI